MWKRTLLQLGRERRRHVEIAAMPQFEHQKLPETQRMVAAFGEMLSDQAIHEALLEVPTLTRAR